MARSPTHSTTTSSGSFIRKTSRQLNAPATSPPSGTPAIAPIVMIVTTNPIARPRCCGSTLVVMIGM
jgi:hypothetical protein